MAISIGNYTNGPDKKLCNHCKKKNPPVETILIVGENITKYRYEHRNFICNECDNIRQRRYRNEKFAELKEQEHIEAIEKLTEAWNDPVYKNTKEDSDRALKVWDKNDWRSKDRGFVIDWICEAIFPDWWNVDPNTVIEDYFMNRPHISRSTRFSIKSHLLEFVSSQMNLFVGLYREKARDRWKAIARAIERKYHGRDKLVASPAYIHPITKESIYNWYLLSKEEDRQDRENIRDSRIERLNAITDEEKRLVLRREEIELRQKAKTEKEGGEQ